MTADRVWEHADPLSAEFFARPADAVARELLGAVLVSTLDGRVTAGRIVEAEAYLGPHDPASHAAERVGRTRRNAAMFGPPGTVYVYRIYGIHWCLNVVTDAPGFPAAVLLRALEPVCGLSVMRWRRGLAGGGTALVGAGSGSATALGSPPAVRLVAGGPGRLAQALGITGELDGHSLQSPPLRIAAGETVADAAVAMGPRVGVTRAADWPLRFFERGNPCVSR